MLLLLLLLVLLLLFPGLVDSSANQSFSYVGTTVVRFCLSVIACSWINGRDGLTARLSETNAGSLLYFATLSNRAVTLTLLLLQAWAQWEGRSNLITELSGSLTVLFHSANLHPLLFIALIVLHYAHLCIPQLVPIMDLSWIPICLKVLVAPIRRYKLPQQAQAQQAQAELVDPPQAQAELVEPPQAHVRNNS